MKRALISTISLLLALPLSAQPTTQPIATDHYDFELAPAAPPSPALKYQLLYSNLTDRIPGDAVPLYFDAALTLGNDLDERFTKAEDALDAGDAKTFATLIDDYHGTELYEELELAARREHCDWQPPFREMGVRTLLPSLNTCRQLARAIRVRAIRQNQLGKPDEAIRTLRLGYELAEKIGTSPFVVSGLVSVGITAYLNDALVQVINHADAPNLYWALVELPPRKSFLHLDGERLGTSTLTLPALARVRSGDELSAEQWRNTLSAINDLPWREREAGQTRPDPVRDASPAVLRRARDDYARTHHLTPAQTTSLDPAIPLGNYYFTQYDIAYDGFFKLRNLPYPIQRAQMRQHAAQIARQIADQPANPFLLRLPYADRALETFVRVDRQLAALTAVEAIRSYASSHDGSLPPTLAAITDTPAPNNPYTDQPFDYKLDGPTATLSAADDRYPLIYTIKIRK